MANILLLVADIWLLSGLVFILHYFSPRFGFLPLILVIGALTAFLENQVGVFVALTPDLLLIVSSNVLVPVILMSVLILYVANGAVPARLTIYGVLGISVLQWGLITVYRLHLSLAGGGSFSQFNTEALIPVLDLRTIFASTIAFAADMFVIAAFYQGVKNTAPKLPEWAVVALSLLASLWTDAVVFGLLSGAGLTQFAKLLPGDVLGKTLSAVVAGIPLAFYMARVAPRMPGYVGSTNRSTFDILAGSFAKVKLALVRTEAALEHVEAERRKEAAYFEQISENIYEAVWLALPQQLHALYVNSAYERIWGRNAESLYANANSFVNSIHPEDKDRVMAAIPTQPTGQYDLEYRIVRPDGSVRWVRDRAFPIRNDKGEIYRWPGSLRTLPNASSSSYNS